MHMDDDKMADLKLTIFNDLVWQSQLSKLLYSFYEKISVTLYLLIPYNNENIYVFHE